MKFFLSYASDSDKPFADELKQEIEGHDVDSPHTVFVDYESLLKSQDTDKRINNLLEQADAVLYLITVSSVRSFWCGKEVGYAQCLGKPIVPIAGPGITGEYIKAQSVPWISGRKWVYWREKERAKKIIESIAYTNDIVAVIDSPMCADRAGPSDADIYYGLHNTREFAIFDLHVRTEIRCHGGKADRPFQKDREDVQLHVDGGMTVTAEGKLSAFKNGSESLSSETVIDVLKHSKDPNSCRAVFLLRYCIGGQEYLTRVLEVPLSEISSGALRAHLVTEGLIHAPSR